MGPKRKPVNVKSQSKYRKDGDGYQENTDSDSELTDKWVPPYPQDMYDDLNGDYDIPYQLDDPYYERKQVLLSDCKSLVSTWGKPLNIAIIGPPGCGKSAFLNTVLASFNLDHWFEHAKSGEFGNYEGVMGMQVSCRLKSYHKEEYYRTNDGRQLPTFIDMTGFENDSSIINEELLHLVFCGKIKENEILNDIMNYGNGNGITAMRQKYRGRVSYRRINRVIVVCSANPESAMPCLLMRTVVKVCKDLDLTYFGVLTHADKYRPKYNTKVAERQETFMKTLGLPKNRFASIANYCPEVDPNLTYEDTVIPSLDVPVLRLMRQVLTPETNDKKMYFEDYENYLIFFAKVAFFIFLVLNIIKFLLKNLL